MLETSRLKLVPLTHELLLLYKNNPEALAQEMNVKFTERQTDPSVVKDVEEAIEFWIKNTLEHRSNFEWYTNWEIILKDELLPVGGVGFAGYPDENGKTMVGYGLDVRFHGKGYATEALTALIHWGFSNENLKAITAETPVKNMGSQNVLIKNGFGETGRDENLIQWILEKVN